MTTTFAFVNVPLNEEAYSSKSRRRAISDKDSQLIRSRAASTKLKRAPRKAKAAADKKDKAGAGDAKRFAKDLPTELPTIFEIIDPLLDYYDEPSDFAPIICDLDISPLTSTTTSTSSSSYSPQSSSDVEEDDMEIFSTPGALDRISPKETSIEREKQEAEEIATKVCSRMIGHVVTGRIDPFWTFSVPFRPFLSATIHHRLTYLAKPKPELDKYFGENVTRKYFLVSMFNPAATLCDSLFSATNLYLLGQDPSSENRIKEADLIWLKGSAYGALFRELRKANKTTEDLHTCASALMSIACYEQCFGDPDSLLKMHINALLQVIKELGGFQNLPQYQQRLLQFMEIEVLIDTDHSFPELAAEQVWHDLTPGYVTSQQEMRMSQSLQPYTNTWVEHRVSKLGSSIFRTLEQAA